MLFVRRSLRCHLFFHHFSDGCFFSVTSSPACSAVCLDGGVRCDAITFAVSLRFYLCVFIFIEMAIHSSTRLKIIQNLSTHNANQFKVLAPLFCPQLTHSHSSYALIRKFIFIALHLFYTRC